VDGWSDGLSLGPDAGTNDEQINPPTNALANNCKLRQLFISNSGGISETGWTTFSNIFRNGNSALESVFMCSNSITDNNMVLFADALAANNHRLKVLGLELYVNLNPDRHHITSFSHILCNKSSILSTFNSNHTLENISDGMIKEEGPFNVLPEDLRRLLQINRNHSNRDAARIKIIKTHFSGSTINVKPFTDIMATNVFPYAIAWMARDIPGMSVLYQFCQHCLKKSKRGLELPISGKKYRGN
jgi:hypothetical protein